MSIENVQVDNKEENRMAISMLIKMWDPQMGLKYVFLRFQMAL